MKQFISILLACVTLISATGIVKIDHNCTMVQEAIASGEKSVNCAEINCCSSNQGNAQGCCSNDYEFITVENGSDYSFSKERTTKKFIDFTIDLLNFTESNKIFSVAPATIAYNKPPPKWQSLNLHIIFGCFLC